MNNRKSTSHHKSKNRSVIRSASTGLIDFLKTRYDKGIPISLVTAAHKLYGKGRTLTKEDKFMVRFADKKGNLDTNKLSDYLVTPEVSQKGKGLTEESMRRVFDNCSNHDGKLTFEYIMKMSDSCGVTINEKMAKGIVRKYGKRKDHLNLQDCARVNRRRLQTSVTARRR